MAKYTGSISLVDMSDITATAGVGISYTKVLYALSGTGDLPPDLEGASLKIDGVDGTLSFSDLGTTLHIEDSILYGYYNDFKVELKINGENNITGTEGWVTTMPTVGPGQYLWTKTIYYYTNGDETIVYGVYRQGEDGKQGEQGPPGSSASSYRISANQTEILKFVSLDGNTVTFSPENLQFAIYKDQTAPGSDIYYEQIRGLSKDNFSISVYNINTDQYVDIPSNFINFDETQDVFNIDLYNLSQGTLAFDILLEEECLVKYSYLLESEEGNFNLVDYLNVRYGIKKDMAALSVEAGKIVQSIQDSYLTFSATGLTIQNGGFQILNRNGDPVLWSSADTGNLTVTGTIQADAGYFAGELRSKSGFFEGTITAKSGKIGGFNILEDRLTSEKTHVKVIDEQDTYIPNIILDGTNGQIIAHNIVLGSSAEIEDYLKIGEAFIYNPNIYENKFIKAGNINLKQTGILNLGSIEMHGGDETTQAYMKSENGNWLIREDGLAIFNDIYADNVHLQDTILEIGTVQAMGSLMLFKDSWSITSANNNVIVVNGLTNLSVNDWIYSGKNIYKIVGLIQDDTTATITLNKTYNLNDGLIITKFGKTSDSQVPGFILSILGEQAIINDNRAFASGNALTISDFVEQNGALIYTKRLVLGQLDGAIDKNITGLGLYADNVFLNGSLTTKVDDDSYAGINTIGEATATVFGDKDNSRIIFWAGSTSSSNIDIQKAPFQVTEMGSIYATKGVFKDSIISDSSIQGADIYAARIHGGTTEQSNSLSIYDTSMGIIFKEGYQTIEKEIFAIRADGFQQNNDYFIEIKDNKVGFYGDAFIVDTRKDNYLEIVSNTINGVDLSMKIISDGLSSERSYQNFTNDKISFGFNQGSNREDSIIISKDKSQIKSLAIWLEKDVYFGSSTSYMQYKKAEEGYDLFINE